MTRTPLSSGNIELNQHDGYSKPRPPERSEWTGTPPCHTHSTRPVVLCSLQPPPIRLINQTTRPTSPVGVGVGPSDESLVPTPRGQSGSRHPAGDVRTRWRMPLSNGNWMPSAPSAPQPGRPRPSGQRPTAPCISSRIQYCGRGERICAGPESDRSRGAAARRPHMATA